MSNICKSVKLEENDLAQINKLTHRELGADEVYTFAVRLCDNEVDRDLERFGDGTLEELAGLFLGAPGIFDHCWSAKGQTARLYRTEVVTDGGILTADGRPYRYLKGWAYMMRTEDTAPLIAEIDGGIKREVSVGCAVKQTVCSICGQELGRCIHRKGQKYGSETCFGVLTGAVDAYEWSFVAVPAQKQAGVVNKRYGGRELPPEENEESTKALQMARARLGLEKIRYGGN